jgi:hypothetical protein
MDELINVEKLHLIRSSRNLKLEKQRPTGCGIKYGVPGIQVRRTNEDYRDN